MIEKIEYPKDELKLKELSRDFNIESKIQKKKYSIEYSSLCYGKIFKKEITRVYYDDDVFSIAITKEIFNEIKSILEKLHQKFNIKITERENEYY